MLTRQQLADLLRDVRVDDLARESGLSTKTIYRLRSQQHAPTLDTVQALLDAIARMSAAEARDAA